MSVNVIDTIKPKNGGSFPVVEAVDVAVSGGTRLNTALDSKASTADLATVAASISNKADKTDITELRTTLALKANQSSLDATNVIVASKAAQSSLDALSVIVSGKADKSDYSDIYAALDTKANKNDVNTAIANVEQEMELADASLQNQIDQIEISASAEAVVAPEVAAARVDTYSVSHDTLKARIDSDANGEKADINYINDKALGFFMYNLIDSAALENLVEDEYVQYDDGVAHSVAGWCHTDYLAALPNAEYSANHATHVCFYDVNKTYLSGTLTKQTVDGVVYPTNFTTPNGCHYMIVSYQTSNDDTCIIPGATSLTYSPDEKHLNYIFETNNSYSSTTEPISAHTFGAELLDISEIKLEDRNIEYGVYYNALNNGRKTTQLEYCATDMISVKAERNYDVSGITEGHVCFYNASGTFLSGTLLNQTYQSVTYGETFTTPENCEFVIISLKTAKLDTGILKSILESSSAYKPVYKYVVSKDGSGNFTTVSAAVAAASDGDCIYIKKGKYEEELNLTKNLHLVGESRINTIIYNTNGNYSHAPIVMGAGMIENLTVYAEDNESSPEQPLTYAIHVEKHTLYNNELVIKDCILKSDFNAAFGMGMRGGCNILLENVDFVNTSGDRALYFHDSDFNDYLGVQNITVRNCRMKVTGGNSEGIITMQSQEKSGSMVYVTYQNNHVFSKQGSADLKCFNYYGGTSTNPDDFKGMINWRLTDDSFGNNVNDLNA